MFRGNHQTRVDEKFRLKMPAEFKRMVDEEYGPVFYITSQDGRRAQLWPMKVWEAYEAKIVQLEETRPGPGGFPERDQLLRPDGRDGLAGEVVATAGDSGVGEIDGRCERVRHADDSRSDQPRDIPGRADGSEWICGVVSLEQVCVAEKTKALKG